MNEEKLANLSWSLIRPIATVFTGEVDRWLEEATQKAASRISQGKNSETQDPIEQLLIEEMDRVVLKMNSGKYRYIALVEGEFGFDKRNCEIVHIGEFFDILYGGLKDRLYRVKAKGGWDEGSGKPVGSHKGPSLVEVLDRPIFLVSDEDIYNWVEKVAKNISEKVLSKIDTREKLYDPEVLLYDAVEMEAEKIVGRLSDKLKEIGGQYINIFEGELNYPGSRGSCQLTPVRDFIIDLLVAVTDRAFEIL
jgi:hypothetical protein